MLNCRGRRVGEDVRRPAPREAYRRKVVEDFEDGAAGAAGVVEELIAVDGVSELEESIAVHGVGGEFCEDFEEEAPGYGGYVEVMEEEGAEGGRVGVVDVVLSGHEGGIEVGAGGGDECERFVCVGGPIHELDEAIDVFREVLWED